MDELHDDAAKLLADPTWTSAAYHDAGSCWKLLRVVAELGHKWQDMADKLVSDMRKARIPCSCGYTHEDLTDSIGMESALAEYDKAKKGQ